jgi:hypothetical protein
VTTSLEAGGLAAVMITCGNVAPTDRGERSNLSETRTIHCVPQSEIQRYSRASEPPTSARANPFSCVVPMYSRVARWLQFTDRELRNDEQNQCHHTSTGSRTVLARRVCRLAALPHGRAADDKMKKRILFFAKSSGFEHDPARRSGGAPFLSELSSQPSARSTASSSSP